MFFTQPSWGWPSANFVSVHRSIPWDHVGMHDFRPSFWIILDGAKKAALLGLFHAVDLHMLLCHSFHQGLHPDVDA